MWYVNVGMKVIQTNVYEKFFPTGTMDVEDLKNKLRKEIKQQKEKSGQFILKHVDGEPTKWKFENISGDHKDKWYLYNEDSEEYSIIHHLNEEGNAWYHNSHSSSSSMYERIFEAYRTIYNNNLELRKLNPSKDQKLIDKFNESTSALQRRLRQNMDIMEKLRLVDNPEHTYKLDDVLNHKVKIYLPHQPPELPTLNEALYNRLKQIKDYAAKNSSVPREIHSKVKKEKAIAKKQAGAAGMEVEQNHTATPSQSQFPTQPVIW